MLVPQMLNVFQFWKQFWRTEQEAGGLNINYRNALLPYLTAVAVKDQLKRREDDSFSRSELSCLRKMV